MEVAEIGGLCLHYRIDGPKDGAPLVFVNSLGADFRLWDQVVARLPGRLRILRFDKRGHGLSDCPPGPYTMAALVADTERLMAALGFENAVVVGLSIGGMIAQGLALKRPDLVCAIVLSNTGAKIGTPEMWAQRIAAIRTQGIAAIADQVLERWFPLPFRASRAAVPWRHMLTRTPAEGYLGCAAAIAGADFRSELGALTIPALGIAGSEDGSTPPAAVRETLALIPGSRVEVIEGSGHLPCVDQPERFVQILTAFLAELGWLREQSQARG